MTFRTTLRIAAILGALGVGLGAFGAHGLGSMLAANGRSATFETAVRYHFYHALALLAVALLQWRHPHERVLGRVALCFALGVVLFSGSLYGLALGGPGWLGPVTPAGGLFFIAGWLLLAARAGALAPGPEA